MIVTALTVGVFGFVGSLGDDPSGNAEAAETADATALSAPPSGSADAPTFDVALAYLH